ncbi:MAG: hypothetical protein VYC40_01125 [Pseudomonadota bacterium]|nr:hypothetical protein [Pseudomonadota bacterium]
MKQCNQKKTNGPILPIACFHQTIRETDLLCFDNDPSSLYSPQANNSLLINPLIFILQYETTKITNRQGCITLKKTADDKVHFTKPSTKVFHGFVIPTIDTTQRPTNAKKSARFSPQTQTFYFEQDTPKNPLHAASISYLKSMKQLTT